MKKEDSLQKQIEDNAKAILRDEFPILKDAALLRFASTKMKDVIPRYPGEMVLSLNALKKGDELEIYRVRGQIIKRCRDMGYANRVLITFQGEVLAFCSYEATP